MRESKRSTCMFVILMWWVNANRCEYMLQSAVIAAAFRQMCLHFKPTFGSKQHKFALHNSAALAANAVKPPSRIPRKSLYGQVSNRNCNLHQI